MAVAVVNEAVRRLSAALGLERCRTATLRLSVDDVVTLTTESYALQASIGRLADELETGEFVVITKAEYERLKENQEGER